MRRPRFAPSRRTHRPAEQGQIIVVFALAVVVVLGMVGLILDGGDTFAQRRFQQNSADLAAVAGANAYMHAYTTTPGTPVQRRTAALAAVGPAAIAAATANGYTDGVDGSVVTVDPPELLLSGVNVHVGVSKPHQNTFARVVGQGQWQVSVDATAITGSIDTAVGAAPWTMSIEAFNPDGSPKYTSANPQAFGDGNGDFPNDELDIAWTDFNGNNNVNTAEVRHIIDGSNVVTATFAFDQYLGQHNQGNHTALFGDVDQYLSGHDVPVPIVGPPHQPGNTQCVGPTGHTDGCFLGWAMFHVISADGGSSKTITGYFLPSGFQQSPLTVGDCTPAQQAANQCGFIAQTSAFGSYVVKLSD